MESGDNTRIRSLRMEINLLQDWESRIWCQKSRVLWLSKGDNNTTFFHRDGNGAWLTGQDDIEHVMESYYLLLFRK